MENNEDVKKAADVLYVMSEDEELERLAFLKEKAEMDERSGLKNARREAKLEIAKKMKEKNISIEEIIELTGISKEEIDKL